ncbi:transcriptional regulator, LacI family [Amphibacillus marinus]|uniref:Transcriptional regulator, LacI family n=1 Tax=Amphibacillus marinus TaxID=872970 RepID=A0A1H8Q6S7_9BACI|nr:LacI family DNA-binding transcriptional regulator [Amphibacillus marinus]SEO49634.1 transcriptional regulator, LacI family [Amphibacillus marinus]
MKIKDIAKLAGVSPATVSRVMNKNGYVKAEKREAVEKVIREVGYRPNEIAKSLKNKRSNIIGVIVPKISTETASRVLEGITQIAKERNYQLLISNTNLQIEEEINALEFLSNKLVDGIIISATEVTDQHLAVARQLTVPLVVIGQRMAGFTSILYSNNHAVHDLVDHLVQAGHKKIGFIGVDPKDKEVGQVRKQAYMDALNHHQLPYKEELVAIGDFSIESGYQQMASILKKQRPTAVLAVTDHLAIGAIQCIKDNGLSVPADISVTGLGDVKLAKYLSPPLTTVHYYFKTSGQLAASELFNQIDQLNMENKEIYVDYELRIRASVKKIERNS